jgi:hypothetical protein
MRNHPLLADHDAKISMKEFRKLERDIVAQLRKTGVKKPKLIPSAALQPCFLDVPSIPKADFLWSDLWNGFGSIVIGERVRKVLFEETKGKGIAFYPIELRKVGRRRATSPPRIPKSGEPEDMMDSYPVGDRPVAAGPYSQLFVTAHSGYPPGTEPGPACEVCGEALERDLKRWSSQKEAWKKLTPEILESVWDGSPIFRLSGQGSTVLVTDPMKNRLEAIQATNVSFRVYPMVHLNAVSRTCFASRRAWIRALKKARDADQA